MPHVFVSWIYSFHLALFYFVSGYLTKHKHTLALGAYIKKYAYSLLVPYVCLGLLAYAVWVLKNLFHPGAELKSISLWSPLWCMVYGTGMPIYNLVHSSALWFLPALFSVFILHWIVKKCFEKDYFYYSAAVVVFGLGVFSFQQLPFRLPFGIENALLGFLFFATGNVVHQKRIGLQGAFCFIGGIVCLGFQVALLHYQKWPIPSLLSGQIGNPVIYYITAMCGILGLIGLVKQLPSVAFIVTVSKNTLAIFTLQTPLKLIIGGVFFLLEIQFYSDAAKIINGLIVAVFTLGVLSLFADIARKRCPVILGE